MSKDGLNLPNDVEQLKAMIARQFDVLAERERLLVQHATVLSRD
jgi:hypothetical protein